jgi:outer membrane protein OmpA-like peptidoglycan-associated protein
MRAERAGRDRGKRHRAASTATIMIGSMALLTACASRSSESLEYARSAVAAARADREVLAQAPKQLSEAERALNRAESAYRDGADQDEVDHLAYLAEQRAGIAQALAEERLALAEMESLGQQRDPLPVVAGERKNPVVQTELAEQPDALLGEARERENRVAQPEPAKQPDALPVEAPERENPVLQTELAGLQAEGTERGLVVTLSDQALFDLNQAELKPGGMERLARLAEFMGEHPDRNLLIEAHTDSTAPDAFNLRLSQRRANAIEDFLFSQGVEPTRMIATGYGEQLPFASNETAAGRQANRRVELVIHNAGEPTPAPRGELP